MAQNRSFEDQLKSFRNESSIAARYMYADMAIQHAASKSAKLLHRLNNTPTFWIVCAAALQSSAYISLGRIFDVTSKFNVNSMLNSFENNLQLFQRQALAKRKRGGGTEDPEWLAHYLANAYYPTHKDVARLRDIVSKYRLIYERAVKPARNKYLAHREKDGSLEVSQLFAGGTVRELWRLTTFLLQLHSVLWELLENGRKPVFRSVRHSVKSIYEADSQRSTAHESIVGDVKKLMQFIEHAKADYIGGGLRRKPRA